MSVFELRAAVGYPEFGVLAGDLLAAERASSADVGVLAVVLRGEGATVKRCEAGDEVIGRVLQVWGPRG